MCVFDTETNLRTKYTRRTLDSLARTVNWNKHRLIICDNASCKATLDLYDEYKDKVLPFEVIYNSENRGTAKALNKIIKQRKDKEHVCKIDNDVIIDDINWLDQLEEAIERDPLNMGICAGKRNDLDENTWNPNPFYRSELMMLPHEKGQRFIIVEKVKSCIGTLTLFNWRLLDKIGYSYQNSCYGLEDSLTSVRTMIVGMYSCFLTHLVIHHIDNAEDDGYTKFKQKEAGKAWDMYQQLVNEYYEGKRSPYVEYND